jgi:SAM-dependent methyltransferase
MCFPGDLAARLPFDDGSFEAVVAKDVLEHVAAPVALVRELRRVLRPRAGVRMLAGRPTLGLGRLHASSPVHVEELSTPVRGPGIRCRAGSLRIRGSGVGLVTARTRRHRRPWLFVARARVPFHGRNVWLIAWRAAG